MTTHEDLMATIAQIEQQLAEDKVTVQHLQTALEDCDPREVFVLSPELIPDMAEPPRRMNRTTALPSHFIRGLASSLSVHCLTKIC